MIRTPMAAQKDAIETKKKRKRIGWRKLFIHQKLEVRSMEEGFLGSWHAGTVIGCGEQTVNIKYDEILSDDGSGCLVECVKVSPVLNGLVPGIHGTSDNYRGHIRPLPPLIDFQKWSLHYGQCVDVFVQDAWWEGVISDHEDGSDERRIFFPDMGDEMMAKIEMLRITQEWDEVTEKWKRRGNWLLLELIEEVELEWPLLVSVRQIWYEIRLKMGFEKLKEWTSASRGIWTELLLQVLSTSYKLTVKQVFHELNSLGDLVEEGQQLLQFSEPALDAILKPEGIFCDSMAIVPYGTNCQLDNHATPLIDLNNISFHPAEERIAPNDLASTKLDDWLDKNNLTNSMPRPNEAWCVSDPPLSIIPPKGDSISESGSGTESQRCLTVSSDKLKEKGKLKASAGRQKLLWLPAGSDIVPGPAFCPDSISQYIKMSRSTSKCPGLSAIRLEVRKHLSHLGWNIKFKRDGRTNRMRYISPEGEIKDSLLQVCLLLQHGKDIPSTVYKDNERKNDGTAESLISSPFIETPGGAHTVPLNSHCEVVTVEPYYCPEAVIEYSLFKREVQNRHSKNAMKTDGLVLKAKKHLSAIGWEFFLQQRRGGKKELRYKSPSGRTFYSLLTACEWCVTEREFSPCNAYTCEKMKQTLISGKEVFQLTFKDSSPPPIDMESERHLHDYLSKKLLTESSSSTSLPKQLVQQGEVKVHGTRTRQRKRKCGSPLLEEIKECQASVKERDDVDAEISACELRSSKRARQVIVSSSTHQTPRTVLSWLIDGNVVLPRAKVQYRSKKDGRPMKEGKITREGIKCSCCQKVFTLSKFEAHAGSNYHRPAANIFLEDGRSLLDCQLELNRQDNVRKRSEPLEVKGNQHCNANDNICSVCHYGGELVLCDKCPSSFHTSCLGLKEVPDGDWFCPSCCCGICGLSRFSENKEQLADDRLLNCGQCEHQYHIGCVRSKGLVELNYYPEGTWFCNKRCEQIHLGLHDLLGKLIPVGHDNLTWTLLKYKKAEDADQDALNNENLMESCSKLNVALSVMHECFEPVKEPRTRRDLVEDVIFNRWSELNRLNFQGFYTVVLERNDELITVATVRVYGEKVAEIPLVATRFQYRRLGMCRILMNELEKKLMGLGVERLVLPAVTSVLKTWETSFGFSIMKKSERLNFLDCTFLDFQGTVMCQKLLKDIPSAEISLLSTEVQQKVSDHINKNYLDLEGNSAVSEVFQADHVEESEIVNQGNADVLREIGSNTGNLSAPSVSVVNQTPHVDFLSCHNDITRQYSLDVTGHRQPRGTSNKIFKCYKRRRIASCGS